MVEIETATNNTDAACDLRSMPNYLRSANYGDDREESHQMGIGSSDDHRHPHDELNQDLAGSNNDDRYDYHLHSPIHNTEGC
jgi:hypothetical protein